MERNQNNLQNQIVNEQLQVRSKNSNTLIIVCLVIAIVVALSVAACFMVKGMIDNKETTVIENNPYNQMGYTNITGRTIGDVAKIEGISLDEFKAKYSLPDDMTEDTQETVASYHITFAKIAELNGRDVDVLKKELGLGDDITSSTLWLEAENKITIVNYIGKGELYSFKKEYGIDSSVTGSDLWKDVREIVAEKKAADGTTDEAFGSFEYVKNPYNELGYLNFSGRTIEEVAEASGLELSAFLTEYGLPLDMPPDTEEAAAYNSIPLGVFTEKMYGFDVETFKETFQLGDDVNENTPYGVAEGKVKLSLAIGEENLAAYKEQYGLGDDITGDTPYSVIRPIVEQAEYAKQKAAAETAAAEAEAETVYAE